MAPVDVFQQSGETRAINANVHGYRVVEANAATPHGTSIDSAGCDGALQARHRRQFDRSLA